MIWKKIEQKKYIKYMKVHFRSRRKMLWTEIRKLTFRNHTHAINSFDVWSLVYENY